MKKNNKTISCTAKDLYESMNRLAGSAKLRKEVEDSYKKRGMTLKIDKCGIGHLYSPLYVSSLWRKLKKAEKYPRECKCKLCQATKNKKRKCHYCGKMSAEYVHAIGWECMNKKCPHKIENQSREQILKKYKNLGIKI